MPAMTMKPRFLTDDAKGTLTSIREESNHVREQECEEMLKKFPMIKRSTGRKWLHFLFWPRERLFLISFKTGWNTEKATSRNRERQRADLVPTSTRSMCQSQTSHGWSSHWIPALSVKRKPHTSTHTHTDILVWSRYLVCQPAAMCLSTCGFTLHNLAARRVWRTRARRREQ